MNRYERSKYENPRVLPQKPIVEGVESVICSNCESEVGLAMIYEPDTGARFQQPLECPVCDAELEYP